MANVEQVLAFVLLLAGITLVFLGLTRALGVTPLGILVSVVAVAALLFTGGIWFGGRAPRPPVISAAGDGSPILFDVHGRVVAGPHAGQPVASRFPEAVRPEVERHCATVLAGRPARFPCNCEGKPVVFEVRCRCAPPMERSSTGSSCRRVRGRGSWRRCNPFVAPA